jgi:hypothetical protein
MRNKLYVKVLKFESERRKHESILWQLIAGNVKRQIMRIMSGTMLDNVTVILIYTNGCFIYT